MLYSSMYLIRLCFIYPIIGLPLESVFLKMRLNLILRMSHRPFGGNLLSLRKGFPSYLIYFGQCLWVYSFSQNSLMNIEDQNLEKYSR